MDIGGSRLEGDLELVIVLQAVGVVAVAAVFGAAAGLDVGGKPRFWAERAQASGGMGGTGADFHVERLDDGAAFVCPECLQFEDDSWKVSMVKLCILQKKGILLFWRYFE